MPTHDETEAEVRRLCDAGDYDRATTRALRDYGPEVYGFLVAFHREEQAAADVFATLSEAVWRGLAAFAWGSTLRTWMYAVARYTALRYRREGRRFKGDAPLSAFASGLAHQVRSETAVHLRTETKSELARIRESLPEEDQTLLVLRVDRGLAWEELVLVMRDGGAPLDAEARKRESAKLRKRFQVLKEKLQAKLRASGKSE